MAEENPITPQNTTPVAADAVAPAATEETTAVDAAPADAPATNESVTAAAKEVAERIAQSSSVLIALSKNPNVDELSAALGLTFILERLGKRATAIFSGAVPNAIEFLEPEKTFETNTNSLQDFIIALDKEKADHLRYKIDGDFVKVFITPYKTTIDEDDFEFSHGDYNVDLVVALDVDNAGELDEALTEYGRIMHDATSVNIHAGEPGHFGELEWGDSSASSVSEMVFHLAEMLKPRGKELLNKAIATALLAGIVAATNRFSNEYTSSETMRVASQLMAAGADQQLISSSIPVDILTDDVIDATADVAPIHIAQAAKPADPAVLAIQHGEVDFDPDTETFGHAAKVARAAAEQGADPATAQVIAETTEATAPAGSDQEVDQAAIAQAVAEATGAAAPTAEAAPIIPTDPNAVAAPAAPATLVAPAAMAAPVSTDEQAAATAQLDALVAPAAAEPSAALSELSSAAAAGEGKKNLQPLGELPATEQPKDYAAMMEAELNPPEIPAAMATPAPVAAPAPTAEVPVAAPEAPVAVPEMAAPTMPTAAPDQVAAAEPELAPNPLPMPDASTVLPPPPAPFDPSAAPAAPAPTPAPMEPVIAPAMPAEPTMPGVVVPGAEMNTAAAEAQAAIPVGAQPAMQDQVYPDPSAYQIPGVA